MSRQHLGTTACAVLLAAATAAIGDAAFGRADDHPPPPAARRPPPAAAKLYVEKGCYACHGYAGQGGGGGPRLASTTLSLEAFQQQLRHPMENMPPFSPNELSDAKTLELYNYVKALPVKD